MRRITERQHAFFRAAWQENLSLDQAGARQKLTPHVLRRWFAEKRFVEHCRRFIASQRARDALRRQMSRSKAIARWEWLLDHPDKIHGEHHWRLILASAWVEKQLSSPARPRGKSTTLTSQELLHSKPLRTDKQDLLEFMAKKNRDAHMHSHSEA